jgi:pyruvate/2-oxoglutarate dehydrogenase complex dihydrolipoamide dehydrogenase (E3) component
VSDRFDAVVIGAGPAGEVAVEELAAAGMRVALVERELLGGECSHWACIPTKTLLRPAELRAQAARAAGVSTPELDWPDLAGYRDWMVNHQDDADEIEEYERRGITVLKASATVTGPGRVDAGGRALETERIVVATGSEPVVPPIEGLAEAGYWTNREVADLRALPASAVVLGGGPVGVELAQFLARFGVRVALVEGAPRLLPHGDARLGRLVREQLTDDGVDVVVGRRATAVRADGRERVVDLDDDTWLRGEAVVVAVGRRPRADGIGLESAGVRVDGGVTVDERLRAADGVWAIGDVTGVAQLTHVGKYQARVAVGDILGRRVRADYRAVPRVVFTDPEVAAVGLTEAGAREVGHDVESVTLDLPTAIARPYTYARDPKGVLTLVVDRGSDRLLGAWALAPLASEWIHVAVLAIRADIPLTVLADTMPQFPSFYEGVPTALRSLPGGAIGPGAAVP